MINECENKRAFLYCIGVQFKNDEASKSYEIYSLCKTFYVTVSLNCVGRHQPGREVRLQHFTVPVQLVLSTRKLMKADPKYKAEKKDEDKEVAVA